MSQKGSTLSLDGTDAFRANLSESRTFKIILGAGLIFLATAIVYLTLVILQPEDAAVSARAIDADSSRWIAMGEHYSKPAFDARHVAAISSARWNAAGQSYSEPAFDVEHVADVSSARWNALGLQYAHADTYSARYRAMGEWYTR